MRFTIRELVLVTVIAGMGLGWFLDHFALSREISTVKHYSWTYFMQLKKAGIVPHGEPGAEPRAE